MLQSVVRGWLVIAERRLNLLSQVLIHLLTVILVLVLHILIAALVWHAGLRTVLGVLPFDRVLVLIATVLSFEVIKLVVSLRGRSRLLVIVLVISSLINVIRIHVVLRRRTVALALLDVVVDPLIGG